MTSMALGRQSEIIRKLCNSKTFDAKIKAKLIRENEGPVEASDKNWEFSTIFSV